MFDTNILNRQTQPNVLASYLGGMEAGQQVNDQRQRNALAQYASQNGAAIMRGDQSALDGLSGFGLQGLELAQNQQNIQLDREAQRLGMDATRQNMAVQRQTQARLDRQEARQIREALQQADAAAIAEERNVLEGKLGLMAQAHASGDRAAFEGLVTQFGFDQDPNDNITYDNFLAKAGEFTEVLEIYGEVAAEKAQQVTNYIATGDSAAALELPPDGIYNIEAGPNGMKASAVGGGGTNVTVNNGNEAGRFLYGSDAGVPAGWRVDRETGVASPIPGGPAAVEENRGARQQDNRETQSRLRLGTTLESLNLNIGTLESGDGLPVTGAVGDARRTFVGRALTGDGAVDFGNRTDQITTSAALAEVQNMRDNSPTGGAVGQLTDSERIALGNSVTALSNSTSAEEYLRAAKAYRQLALDLAYGAGSWTLNSDGTVSMKAQPSGAAANFDSMSREELLRVDTNSLDDAALDALMKRMDELGL